MKDFFLILPELFLAITLVFVVLSEVAYQQEGRRLAHVTALMGLGAAWLETIVTYHYGPTLGFDRTISVDALALFVKLVAISLSFLSVLVSMTTHEISDSRKTEYCALILAGCIGMCFAASAVNTVLAFFSLQVVTISCFYLSAFQKRSDRSVEAAMKFFILTIFAGALFLFAQALLFSVTKTLQVYDLHAALVKAATIQPIPAMTLAAVFILSFLGLAFSLGVFPGHTLTPDALEGAPTPASSYISVAGRIAAFSVLIRIFMVAFSTQGGGAGQWEVLGGVDWASPLSVMAGLSMLFGALLAYRQNSSKRLVGCLVISNSGALLMGLVTLDQVGVSSILYSFWLEVFSLIGIYYVLSIFFDLIGSDRLEDLRGALKKALPESICLVLFLLSYIGVPPFPGFLARFALVGSVVRHHGYGLAAICVLSMAISTAAVIRLAFHLIGDFNDRISIRETSASVTASSGEFGRRVFLLAICAPLFLSSVFAQFLFDWAGRSLNFIFW